MTSLIGNRSLHFGAIDDATKVAPAHIEMEDQCSHISWCGKTPITLDDALARVCHCGETLFYFIFDRALKKFFLLCDLYIFVQLHPLTLVKISAVECITRYVPVPSLDI